MGLSDLVYIKYLRQLLKHGKFYSYSSTWSRGKKKIGAGRWVREANTMCVWSRWLQVRWTQMIRTTFLYFCYYNFKIMIMTMICWALIMYQVLGYRPCIFNSTLVTTIPWGGFSFHFTDERTEFRERSNFHPARGWQNWHLTPKSMLFLLHVTTIDWVAHMPG